MLRCTGSFLKTFLKNQKVVWKRTTSGESVWSSFVSAESDVFRSSINLYSKCLRNNSKLYVSSVASYAKTKYRLQSIFDRCIHGKREKAAAQVAFMITKDTKQSLADMGYSMAVISELKPVHAQYIINNDILYNTWSTKKEEVIRSCEEIERKKRESMEEEARRAIREMEQNTTTTSIEDDNMGKMNISATTAVSTGLVLVREDDVLEREEYATKKPLEASQPLMVVEKVATKQ